LDPVTANLVEKLSDVNARIREGARKGTDILASSTNIGPAVVGAHALRTLTAKQKSGWRPIVARLQLLTDLINQYGLGSNSGIMAASVMGFAQSNTCFTHSNGEVRDAAKDLTVAVHKLAGIGAVESYLKPLRPKQLEEYEIAFGEKIASATGPAISALPAAMPKKVKGSGGDADGSPSPRHSHKPTQKHHSPGKKGQHVEEEDALDFTTCMFCGMSDPNWNEDSLDLHYWKDCSLLAPCTACGQVVEVAGMADHLLDECEHKADYISCDITGLVVRKDGYDAWKKSPQCEPCPQGMIFCPLCLISVSDTDEAWKEHLFYKCPKNTRSKT
jgi:centrosomal protein CEP104